MKKLLIASTALVASAGFAAAEMSLTGEANMGVKYDSALAANTTRVYNEIDFDVVGSGTTDAGLTFGASVDLDSGYANGAAATNVGDAEVFVSGDFGTLTIGNVDAADDDLSIADVGFDGVGVDDVVEDLRGSDQGNVIADVSYVYSFGDLELIATFHDIAEDYAVVVNYDFGAFFVGLGYAYDDALGDAVRTFNLGGDLGMASVEAIYVDSDVAHNVNGVAATTGWGVDVEFDAGAASIIIAIADNDGAAIDASYGIGFEYGLGGGATLAGGIAAIDTNTGTETRADLGVTMEF